MIEHVELWNYYVRTNDECTLILESKYAGQFCFCISLACVKFVTAEQLRNHVIKHVIWAINVAFLFFRQHCDDALPWKMLLPAFRGNQLMINCRTEADNVIWQCKTQNECSATDCRCFVWLTAAAYAGRYSFVRGKHYRLANGLRVELHWKGSFTVMLLIQFTVAFGASLVVDVRLLGRLSGKCVKECVGNRSGCTCWRDCQNTAWCIGKVA